jgi:hypothetical protein
MEGACIYINSLNESTLLIYKEYSNNKVFLLYYVNYKLYYSFITTKMLTNIIPVDCIHILTKLPFYQNLEKTIEIWRLLVLNELKNNNNFNNNNMHNNIKNNYKNSKTDFYEKFSK